jgi:hypothetical protein
MKKLIIIVLIIGLVIPGCMSMTVTQYNLDDRESVKRGERYGCGMSILGPVFLGALVDITAGYSWAYDEDDDYRRNFGRGTVRSAEIIILDICILNIIHELFVKEPAAAKEKAQSPISSFNIKPY